MTTNPITENEPAAKRWLDFLLIATLLAIAAFVYWPSRDVGADGLAGDSSHYIYPSLNRSTSGADTYCAWHPPPHPEWIPDDASAPRRYPQMTDNGAEEIYPQTAFDNPETIDGFLRSGRPVYFVGLGLFMESDRGAVINLDKRY